MALFMLHVHGWLLIGVAFTAVIHMIGSSVLFLKSFQSEKGLTVYGGVVSVLAVLVLATAVLAARTWGWVLLTAVLTLLCLSLLITLRLPVQSWPYRRFWLASNSSIVALLAFILAKQVASLVG